MIINCDESAGTFEHSLMRKQPSCPVVDRRPAAGSLFVNE
jgi:hypothetical protein